MRVCVLLLVQVKNKDVVAEMKRTDIVIGVCMCFTPCAGKKTGVGAKVK